MDHTWAFSGQHISHPCPTRPVPNRTRSESVPIWMISIRTRRYLEPAIVGNRSDHVPPPPPLHTERTSGRHIGKSHLPLLVINTTKPTKQTGREWSWKMLPVESCSNVSVCVGGSIPEIETDFKGKKFQKWFLLFIQHNEFYASAEHTNTSNRPYTKCGTSLWTRPRLYVSVSHCKQIFLAMCLGCTTAFKLRNGASE